MTSKDDGTSYEGTWTRAKLATAAKANPQREGIPDNDELEAAQKAQQLADNAGLPPARPTDGSVPPRAPFSMAGTDPTATGSTTPAPGASGGSWFDGLGKGLHDNADMLLGLGAGLMSQRGIGNGLAAGLKLGSQMQTSSAANSLAQQKAQREQAALTGNAALYKKYNPTATDAQAVAAAGNSTVMTDLLKRGLPSAETYKQQTDEDGNLFNVNTATTIISSLAVAP